MNGRKWVLILVPLGIFLLGQLLMAVWWAATVNTKLQILSNNQTAIIMGTKDRYTGKDAGEDQERHDSDTDRNWQRQRIRDKEQDDRVNELHDRGQ